MSAMMDEKIGRCVARRKSVLVLAMIQGKTMVLEACRQFDLSPVEIDERGERGGAGMEFALRARKRLGSLLGKNWS